MSGGVDSSVAAALLIDNGYNVSGMTIKLFKEDNRYLKDAETVANQLNIPFYVVDLSKEFEEYVINYFTNEYLNGRTPNPCVVCNKRIKFGLLFEKAVGLGADYIATGHYAKIDYDNNIKKLLLKKSLNNKKDQSYFLYNLTQNILSRTLFPIGNYTKQQIREIAKNFNIKVATKKESQEICFVENDDYVKYIKQRTGIEGNKGYFVDKNGNILGKHKGIINYTIGQRKGLGIAFGKPMYVIGIDAKENKIILGESGDEFSNNLIADKLNFIPFDELENKIHVKAKIRYAAKPAEAYVEPVDDGKVKVSFIKPQRAITPGQSVVFYEDDIVLGGGIIEKIL